KMNLSRFEEFLTSKKAMKELLSKKKQEVEKELEAHRCNLSYLNEALDVMNVVSVLSQREYKEVIEVLVTQALQFVFGNNYSFKIENTISRNQPETSMYVVVDGKEHLLSDDELGYGVVDVVSFALRVVCWAISCQRTDGVFVLDEPLKSIDCGRFDLVGRMLKQLSEMLGIQFIIVTHEDGLAVIGDVSYYVSKKDGVSQVERLENEA
ncbi:MAG: hypothetical protein ACTSUO_03115, partial [Candidatus Thorarchaeota archaeon]